MNIVGHHTDRSPLNLGQYNSPGEYCDPHTASSVFLRLLGLLLVESNQVCDFNHVLDETSMGRLSYGSVRHNVDCAKSIIEVFF